MALKKSELYSSLWKSCDELRGGMDASQYKDYVLVLLFVKYVSDKDAGDPNALIDVPAGGSFADMVVLKNDKEIGDGINKIIGRLADAKLRAQDIHKIVDTFNRQAELPRYARMVPLAEIEANDYNLNLPRYIDSSEPEDLQDIEAHLKGGIPVRDVDHLAAYWDVFPKMREDLFADLDRPGYCRVKLEAAGVKAAICGHPEFAAFKEQVTAVFDKWTRSNKPRLLGIAIGDRPKVLIEAVSENLLDLVRKHFSIARPLIDPYDVYQHLMDYWAETMQDDVYMLVSDGWKAAQDGKPNIDLIPSALIVARYFAAAQAAIEELEAERDALSRDVEEATEEHSGEEGLLEDAKTDRGKMNAKSVKERLKAIRPDKDAAEERKLLEQLLGSIDKEAAVGKRVKDARRALDAQVRAKYGQLSETETKALIVDDKWLTALGGSMQNDLDRVSQSLAGRIRTLAERYATPLPALTEELDVLGARVDAHLKEMGFVWN